MLRLERIDWTNLTEFMHDSVIACQPHVRLGAGRAIFLSFCWYGKRQAGDPTCPASLEIDRRGQHVIAT
jgi:hypothetical protein